MLCLVESEETDLRCATVPFVAAIEGAVCLSPQPVRDKSPNPFGLYGMHGNISEWTQTSRDWVLDDPFGPVSSEPSTAIAATPEFEFYVDDSTYMLTAGTGYWNNIGTNCGNSLFLTRQNLTKILRQQLYGFRLVRTVLD
jgi:formylglycine-generating enzyme required for sulfatase activity